MRKTYYEMQSIGRARYVVNYHDGFTTHRDGSKFYELRIFRNRKDRDAFIRVLREHGYVEEQAIG